MKSKIQKSKTENCKELLKKENITFYDLLNIIENYNGIKLFWWQKIYLYTTCYKQWERCKRSDRNGRRNEMSSL